MPGIGRNRLCRQFWEVIVVGRGSNLKGARLVSSSAKYRVLTQYTLNVTNTRQFLMIAMQSLYYYI